MSGNENPDQAAFWDSWHQKRDTHCADCVDPFVLAEDFLPFLQRRQASPILDLGCGQGNDAIYFARNGVDVCAIDFSKVSLSKLESALKREGIASVQTLTADISEPLPFDDHSFCGVYSHLALHYFDDLTTRAVFSEIRRVLSRDGLLAFAVKSIHDFRYGEGVEIAPDMFNYQGHVRHFFRKEALLDILAMWQILSVEEYKSSYGGSGEPSSFIKVIASKNESNS